MLISYQTQLIKKTNLASNIYLFEFSLIEPKEISFLAGQYLILLIPSKGETISRLYSIASPPWQKNSFELVVELVEGGVGSTYLKNLKIGDKVLFKGPAGMFTLKQTSKNKVFFATGTGIAPIRSMIMEGQKSPFDLEVKSQKFLFWGFRKKEDVYFLEEFKKIKEEDKNFEFKICLSKETSLSPVESDFFSLGHVDYVFEKELYPKIKETIFDFEFYLCGGRGVVESLRQFLLQKNILQSSIFFEKF
jgi:Na+-transporting NADH:ubiquinone oxidoreductase subunit F